jgi:hypothetical protein
LDDDVVAPAIHQDVWAASLDFPNGVSPVPAPGSGERTKYSYFVAFFDAKTGAFLFAESQ